MKRLARHRASLQRQQYGGMAVPRLRWSAVAAFSLSFVKCIFRIAPETALPPSRPLPFFSLSSSTFSDVSARWCTVERAFRSAPHILPLSFCRIRPSTSPFRGAIEFSYVHAIYNVVRAKPPERFFVTRWRADFEAVETRGTCAVRRITTTDDFSFFFLVRVAARTHLCCASISIAVRNAFRCYFFFFFGSRSWPSLN